MISGDPNLRQSSLGKVFIFMETAVITGAMTSQADNERLIRKLTGEAMHHSTLGQNDKSIGRITLAKRHHFQYCILHPPFPVLNRCTLGGQRLVPTQVFQPATFNGFLCKQNMGIATTWPELHISSGLSNYPLAKILIRHEDFLDLWELVQRFLLRFHWYR